MYRGPCLDRCSPVFWSSQELMPYNLTNKGSDWVMVLPQFQRHLLIFLGNSLLKWGSKMVSRPWWGSSKDMHWLLLAWDDAKVEVIGGLRLIVAVSVDAEARIDGEGERFATGATNVGDVVGADIMRSNITLGSLCCHIISWWPGFHPAFTGFTNVCLSVAALKSLMCRSLLSGVQEYHIGAYQFLSSWESTYLPPPYRASTSSFSSRSIKILNGIDCLQDTAHPEALNMFLNSMNWLYVILVEQTHYICTFSCRLDDTLEKPFLVVS